MKNVNTQVRFNNDSMNDHKVDGIVKKDSNYYRANNKSIKVIYRLVRTTIKLKA
jgi:hypothetical protein